MKKKLIPSLLLAAMFATTAHAQTVADSICATVYFRLASARIELPYMDNAAQLKAFTECIRRMGTDPVAAIKSIRIVSSASPEGNTEFNRKLSELRGKELLNYIKTNLSLPDSIFVLRSEGEDWNGLALQVKKTDMPWRDKALSVIRTNPEWIMRGGKVVDSRKLQLMNLYGGRAWSYMRDNFFEKLRGGVLVVCEVERTEPIPAAEETVKPEATADTVSVSHIDEQPGRVEVTETYKALSQEDTPFYMAVKTNLLYDAALVPNVGVEFGFGKGWGVGLNWMYAWWKNDHRHRYWRIYGGELVVRKYLGGTPMRGHHIGAYTQRVTYDFELGGKGYLGEYAYGTGVEYGYSMPVAKRLNFDFSIGIGYLGGKYKVYTPEDECYVYQETKKRHWFGPTRAEVSLVWLLGHGNVNSKKGGNK